MESSAKGKDQNYKNQHEKTKELESQLVLKSNLHSQSEKQVTQLSDRLKGREELCSGLQTKVKELETKLRDRQQSQSVNFQQKIEELEHKLKEQEQQLQNRLADLTRATPNEGKTCILRSSTRLLSQGSVLRKGKDDLHPTRKKRESRSGEKENTNIASASLHVNKKGKSEPSKFARMIRPAKPAKPVKPVTTVQGPSTSKKKI